MANRTLVVLEHLSLDGVIQGPGGPDEDPSGGFTLGGWSGLYSDPLLGAQVGTQMKQKFDLLLGRRTFEIWEPYWPHHPEVWPEVNAATKYVASRTRTSSDWGPTLFLGGEVADEVRRLKAQPGPDLHVWGSSQLVQELLRHGLVDEFWLMLYPVVLGSGKRLFAPGAVPTSFRVVDSLTTPRGVLVVRYHRAES